MREYRGIYAAAIAPRGKQGDIDPGAAVEIICAALVALLLAGGVALAQPAPAVSRSRAQVLTFRSTVDNSDQPYAIHVPQPLETGRKYPLLVTLHAEESSHRLNLMQIFGVLPRFGLMDPEDLRLLTISRDPGYIVAAPLARGSMGYRGIAETDVYEMLADVQKRFPVDPDRVYLTGISMGGGGALWLALTRPDVWAAVVPLCPSAVPGAEELAPNASNLPIRLFQGELDPIVAVAQTRALHRRLLNAGVAADYIEYPGVRHNVWEPAFRGGALFEWLDKFRRNRYPDQVRLVTRSYRYGSAYWVRVDGLVPGALASVEAKRGDTGAIEVRTANVDGFTLTLDRPVSLVTIDGAPLKLKAAATVSFERVAGKWRAGRLKPSAKRPGLEGPISEAVSGRHIYVYGTVGATPDEVAERRKLAEEAANWSTTRTRIGVKFPVKADTELTPEDIGSSDLVLFGTAETNAVLARIAPSLPLQLSPGAADYGLLFIAPLGERYALVNSGLPWWTGADEARRGGQPIVPAQFRLLSTFGDYVLFKGSLAHVVSEGHFDRNWKVPPGASAQMLASGTVTIPSQ